MVKKKSTHQPTAKAHLRVQTEKTKATRSGGRKKEMTCYRCASDFLTTPNPITATVEAHPLLPRSRGYDPCDVCASAWRKHCKGCDLEEWSQWWGTPKWMNIRTVHINFLNTRSGEDVPSIQQETIDSHELSAECCLGNHWPPLIYKTAHGEAPPSIVSWEENANGELVQGVLVYMPI